MTLLLINKQSRNDINTGCSYCTEPSTNLSLLRYFSSFRAVWYGVCARSWTELMLFKKGSRSHKKVRLILDYMSHKWLHCQIQGESLGGEREEVGLRHSSEEQTNGISLLILKKTWGCYVRACCCYCFTTPRCIIIIMIAIQLGQKKKCQKLLSSVLKEFVK